MAPHLNNSKLTRKDERKEKKSSIKISKEEKFSQPFSSFCKKFTQETLSSIKYSPPLYNFTTKTILHFISNKNRHKYGYNISKSFTADLTQLLWTVTFKTINTNNKLKSNKFHGPYKSH